MKLILDPSDLGVQYQEREGSTVVGATIPAASVTFEKLNQKAQEAACKTCGGGGTAVYYTFDRAYHNRIMVPQ